MIDFVKLGVLHCVPALQIKQPSAYESKTKASIHVNQFQKTPERLNTRHQLSNEKIIAFELPKPAGRYKWSGGGKKTHLHRRASRGGISRWFERVFLLTGLCITGIMSPEWSPIVRGEVMMAYLPYWLLIPCLCWLCLYSSPLQPEDLRQIKTTVSNRDSVHIIHRKKETVLTCAWWKHRLTLVNFSCCQPDNSFTLFISGGIRCAELRWKCR